jgi:hypothetical protein
MKEDPDAYKKDHRWVAGVLEEKLTPWQHYNNRQWVESMVSGEAHEMIEAAKSMGMTCLYGFGQYERRLYESHGFETVKSLPWLEEYRPEGWNEAKYGRPNRYYLRLKRLHKD